MKLRWGILGLVAACGVCCAPLIMPFLVGAGLVGIGSGAGLVFGLTWEQALCIGLPLAGIALVVALWFRREAKRQASCRCETKCTPETCATPKGV